MGKASVWSMEGCGSHPDWVMPSTSKLTLAQGRNVDVGLNVPAFQPFGELREILLFCLCQNT